MSVKGVNLRSKKISSDYLLDNAESCEVRAELREIHDSKTVGQLVYGFSVSFISHRNSRYKTTEVITAPNKGTASIRIICRLIEKIDGVKFKNVNIFYDSQYVVGLIPKLETMIKSGKIKDSPNHVDLTRLHELLQTVGKRYSINIRIGKIIKVFEERRSYE